LFIRSRPICVKPDTVVLLVLFALIAGAGTAVSPCVLPVLPALLSASATGGRRRPFGIVLGLAVTFTVTIVGLAKVVDGVGLGDSVTRDIAIVALALFGLTVAIPRLGDRLEAPLSRLARFGPSSGGRGFFSGLLVGAALGFVYAPCAGPILAAVVSVSAASGRTVVVGLAYALGSSIVLLILALAGRRLTVRLRGPGLSRALGGVMVLTALAMAFQLDIRFQTAIADHLPAALVNPTKSIESSRTVSDKLASLRPPSRFENAASGGDAELDDYGPAPDFVGNDRWFNSKPLTIAALRGRVVLIDFWTYTCINCIRTFPHLKAWDAKYRDQGLTIVGVHSPEFGFEKKASNVERAIEQNGLAYPVAQDNELATWNAWSNQYWPAEYLIDAQGHVRYVNFGEGNTDKTEAAIRTLLRDAGARGLGADAKPDREYDPSAEATPETYLGSDRAERFLPGVQQPGTADYTPYGGSLPESHFTLGGRWKVTGESATAGPGAMLRGNVTGKDVYLVLSGPGTVDVRVDGKPEQTVKVTTQKLYHLLSRPKAAAHDLQLTFSAGVSAFAFTFG
jgi:cytochrome c biogenesis protein CcdA/thiol-disulfide isomerase/thioredoxin